MNSVAFRLTRESDGHTFTATKGTPNTRYISSSTVKPITAAVCAWAVQQGHLTHAALAVDEVAEFDALATNEQRNITLGHLLSFTSGLSNQTPNANSVSSDWEDYVDNLAGIASISNDANVPGALHNYATDQHGLAAAMCVRAGGYASWAALVTAFIADTGIFPGLSWVDGANQVFSGNTQVSYTAEEFTEFLRAVFNETILTSALCQDLYADHIASNPSRTTMYTWLTDNGMTGEDWHFGRGIWLEQRNADWVGAQGSTRISTIGVAGQYCFHDTALGVTGILTPFFPGVGDEERFADAIDFVRSIESDITTWAGE